MTTVNLGLITTDQSNFVSFIIIIIETIVIFLTLFKIKKDKEVIHALEENIETLGENSKVVAENTNTTEENTNYLKIYKREELYQSLAETTINARNYVHQLSVSQSGPENLDENERRLADKFLDALKTAKNKNHVDDIKILGPKMIQKVSGLYEREKCGAEVKVLSTITLYDIRIHVVDDEQVVIGFSQCGEKCERAYIIRSYDLAKILNSEFMRLWDSPDSKPLIEYIGEDIIFDNRCIMPLDKFDELLARVLYISDKNSKNELLTALMKGGYLKTLNDHVLNYYKLIEKIPTKEVLSIEEIKKRCGEAGENLTDSDANLIMSLFKEEGTKEEV